MTKGQINVQAENIFPIIKQFLYSDQEIFLRELVSNATDATSKLLTLSRRGEVKGEVGDTTIEILLDKEAKTLTIRDKGIGMTEEEVEKYLNQVAFSSAEEFLEKYKNEASIIGHFGLGFYSAFMVADRVEVVTRSYKEDTDAVKWTCSGDPNYEMGAGKRDFRGTDVILHISEDSVEFLEKERIDTLLDKYCKFLPVEIKFGTRTETTYEGEGEDEKKIEIEVDNIVNNPNPLWKKQPAELKEEDYTAFYNELYPHSTPPLFHIHLNIDFPFSLTGVLYFPKLSNSLEVQKNKIQLYSNQVYVTDDVKEIVPEWLTLLHGVIDSPDIPLNVSRSYLQSDSNVRKITGYITKKVADKLHDLYKEDRNDFEDKWSSLGVFVKYGMLSDEKFNDRVVKNDFALVKNTEEKHFTINEYKEKVKETQTDKHDRLIFLYTNDATAHDSYIAAAQARGYDVLVMDNPAIDSHFIQHLEQKVGGITFVRVDSDTADNLVQKDETAESVLSEKEQETVKTVFSGIMDNQNVTVDLKPLSPTDQPVQITRAEFMRRMKEMSQFSSMPGMGEMPDAYNVVVNTNHPLVADKLLKGDEATQKSMAEYLYQVALIQQGMLKGKDLTAFVEKSLGML